MKAAVGWLVAAACLACAAEPPPGGNVLLLIADDLGTERVGAYGAADAPPTPSLDALAADGLLFERAYVAPMCSPTRAAILTGRHPRRYGLGGQIKVDRDVYELPLSEVTLPEMLDASPLGYANAAVGKWHLASQLGPSAGRHPLLSGFDWYAGNFANFQVTTRPTERRRGYRYWEKNTNGVFAFVETYATTDTVNDALALAERLPEPWFLQVAFNAVHFPLHEPPAHLHTRPSLARKAERFDAMVEALDSEIGRLLGSIEPDVLARTTVIFVGDNGTPEAALLERDDPRRKRPMDERRGLTRSKGTLYEAGIRVPLIVASPLVARPGARSAALVHVIDLFPTLAEIAEVDVTRITGPDGEAVVIDGRSLLPHLADPTTPSRRDFVYQDQFGPIGAGPYSFDRRMIRDERYKLIANRPGGAFEFFDLAGRTDDGPDLVLRMDAAQREAFERLRRRLDETVAALESGEPVGG